MSWRDRSRRNRGNQWRRVIRKIVIYGVLILGSFILLIPIFWMISTSLKPFEQTLIFPPRWIPDIIKWDNYSETFTYLPFWLYYRNSIIVTISAVIGQVISASLVAFSFARLRARGRDFFFFLMLSTMMIPIYVRIIPLYIIFKQLHWLNTFKPLIVPYWLGGAAFNIFLLRQFFRTIPIEIDESAKIDGCGTFRTYWQFILPLSKPALAAVIIFSFMFHWNDFFGPLIYMSSTDKFTLPLGLMGFKDMYYTPIWNLLMAGSIMALLPCVLVFFFTQRYFVQGITLTGLKR